MPSSCPPPQAPIQSELCTATPRIDSTRHSAPRACLSAEHIPWIRRLERSSEAVVRWDERLAVEPLRLDTVHGAESALRKEVTRRWLTEPASRLHPAPEASPTEAAPRPP